MAKVELLAPFVKKWEGGWSNHPNDPGGATNKGITLSVYTKHGRDLNRDGKIDVNDLKILTDEEFNRILKTLYWDKCQADKINSQPIANLIVGWAWGERTSDSHQTGSTAFGTQRGRYVRF